MKEKLVVSSCQAPNMDFLVTDLAAYLSEQLGLPVDPRLDIPWQQRESRLDEGQIDLCWICGLPYVLKADRYPSRIRLLAAPVMYAERYRNEPIYFSDVVVRSDSPYQHLEDLRGARWAYNEPGSQSGYNIVRYGLAKLGEKGGFFGQVVESGAHQISLQMILDGEIDGSAIDSTVLEQELLDDPAIISQIRIIDTLGPSPIPPWVTPIDLDVETHQRLLGCMLGMQADPHGRQILTRAGLARFSAVQDKDYDPIREMSRAAINVRLSNRSSGANLP
ncbi:MAG: PhnD/SsuA/transferrin family substrate-binding protein [Anaerolineaceae bacterium]|nr:PhnD/SsuA/transferrin family substrate-binding protein [Anaerolineaceae bacterium]